MSDMRWHQRQSDGRDVWRNQSTFNPAPIQVIQGAAGTNVLYLDAKIGYTGSVVVPVQNGTEYMVIKPTQTVLAYQSNSSLPTPVVQSGTVNSQATTCTDGVQTRIYFSGNAKYDVVEFRGPVGTVINIEMADAVVTQNGDVLAGCYATMGNTALVSVLSGPYEAINLSNQYRIRQDGTVNKVEFYNGLKVGVTEVTVGIWRYNVTSTLFDLVGRTENLIDKLLLVTGASQVVTLDTPIQGVKAGDFISIRCVCHNSVTGPLYTHTNSGSKIWYTLPNVWSTDTDFDWDAGGAITASANYAIPVRVYMEAPEYLFSGDKSLSSSAYNGSYCQGNATLVSDDPQSTVAYNTAMKMGAKYFQNLSVDGNTLASYFTWALAHSAYKQKTQIMCLGLNDVIAGTDVATTQAAVEAGISGMLGAGINPVFVLPIPCTALTNDQQVLMSDTKDMIVSQCALNSIPCIDTGSLLAMDRTQFAISRVQRDLVNILFTHLSRTSNVATATCASPHGLQTGDEIIVKAVEFAGGVDNSFNSSQVSVTRIDATKFSYASTGTAKVETACVAGSLDHPIALITSVGHGLSNNMVVDISDVTTADFDVTGAVITKQSADTFSYSNFGIAVSDTADTTGYFENDDILPAGNSYDIATAYDSGDGITLNAAGNIIFGNYIATQLKEADL